MNGKLVLQEKFHRIDLVIFSHSREVETLSCRRVNTGHVIQYVQNACLAGFNIKYQLIVQYTVTAPSKSSLIWLYTVYSSIMFKYIG